MPTVSVAAEHRGLAEFGAKRSNQIVIWETPMDAETVLLIANTETVYALGHLDLKTDGPTVVEAPPKMLGFAMDALQRYLVDIGPLGPDKGQGGKYLFFHPAMRARSRMDISPSSRRAMSSVSECAVSRWTARPTRP